MQQNITFRNSPPSASSMKEGQIIFARNSKGVSMYTKQGSQLFSSQFNSSSFVDRPASKITPNIVEAKNLSYSKFTDYRTFMHNFDDDIGTAKHYLPWGNTVEGGNMRTFTSYLAPFKMTFHKLLIRTADINASANYTFTIDINKDGSDTIYELGSQQLRNKTISTDLTFYTIRGSDFLINSPFDNLSVGVGEKAGISITADVDPVSASRYWAITSVWKVEVDLS